MNETLKKHLMDKGIPAEQAEEIAKSYTGDAANVDADRLSKALETLHKSVEVEVKAEFQAALDDAAAQATNAQEAVQAISKSADKLVGAFGTAIETLRKSQTDIVGVLDTFAGSVKELTAKVEALTASSASTDETVRKALGMPVPPRAVTTDQVVPAPGDTTKNVSRTKVTDAALEAMRKASDPTRQHELAKAVAMLSSGANPDAIVKDFNISVD